MTASDHRYETSADRASLAREAGVGKLAGIGSLAAMLIGALVGGALGERWHSKWSCSCEPN